MILARNGHLCVRHMRRMVPSNPPNGTSNPLTQKLEVLIFVIFRFSRRLNRMRNSVEKIQELVTRETVRKIACGISHLEFLTESGGLYCSFFRNSLVFCHFIRKTRIFCCLRTSLSALQSLLWTSKVPKKSNTSNKTEFPTLEANSRHLSRKLREKMRCCVVGPRETYP